MNRSLFWMLWHWNLPESRRDQTECALGFWWQESLGRLLQRRLQVIGIDELMLDAFASLSMKQTIEKTKLVHFFEDLLNAYLGHFFLFQESLLWNLSCGRCSCAHQILLCCFLPCYLVRHFLAEHFGCTLQEGHRPKKTDARIVSTIIWKLAQLFLCMVLLAAFRDLFVCWCTICLLAILACKCDWPACEPDTCSLNKRKYP